VSELSTVANSTPGLGAKSRILTGELVEEGLISA